MDKFLEKYNLPKLNEEEVESLNRPKTVGEIDAIIKKLLVYKSPGEEDFTRKLHKTLKEELTFSDYSKNPRRVKTSNSDYEGSIILIPKPEKDTQKRKKTIVQSVSYTHLTLPTIPFECRSRWSPYH